MRRKIGIRVVLLAALGAALMSVSACDLEDVVSARFEATRAETAAFPAPGIPMIEVASSNGAVSIRGVPGQADVRVTATLRARGGNPSEANKRVAAMTIHMEQQGSRIVLAYRASEQTPDVRRYGGVTFDVTAPGIVDLVAQTSNGAVTASSLQGGLDLRTSNGEIAVADVIGQLQAETSNGRISVERTQGVLDLKTSNGEISMVDVSAAFGASTSNGRIGFSGTAVGDANGLDTSNGRIEVAVAPSAAIEFQAEVSVGTISSSLPLVGDTQGKEWLATLNPPATAKIALRTSNGSIHIAGRP
jgi:hypothetical protein